MAEIKNLTNQIQVVGSGNQFNDSIKFYNKLDVSNNTAIGVKASGGKIVLFNIVNGVEAEAIESFDYTDIILPVSANLEELVLIVHNYIYDAPKKKNIESSFVSATPNPDALRVSNTYDFNSSKCTVTLHDYDMDDILSVFNETAGKVLYNKGSEEYTGRIVKNVLTFDRRLSGLMDQDTLYIIYKSKNTHSTEDILLKMLWEIEEVSRQAKINNLILTESTEVDIYKDEIQL